MSDSQGFFSRFFHKEQPHEQAVNLDEIKKKLGLDDALEPPKPEQNPQPMDDFKGDLTSTEFTSLPPLEEKTAVEFVEPEHHKLVDKHIGEVKKKQHKVEETLDKVTAPPEIPEWKFQDKEVVPEQYFILRNGQPVRSVKELIEAVEYIDDSTFQHHVNEYRNDFANWIRDVIQDPELADQVQQATQKDSMIEILSHHKRQVHQKMQQETVKVQKIVQKREETLKKLGTVEDQIATLKRELEKKTRELEDERHHTAKMIKEKLDEEVAKRLEKEKHALMAAREDLAKAKRAYAEKQQQYEHLLQGLSERDKHSSTKEQKAMAALSKIEDERQKLKHEKEEATHMLHDAAKLKKQFEDMKKLDKQTKDNLHVITQKEINLSRREETMRHREKKVTADLTRIEHEREMLKAEKEQMAPRQLEIKKMEAEAHRLVRDAGERVKIATDVERESKEKIGAEMKKLLMTRKQLEMLRSKVDKALAKALGEKRKITNAVALRKHLEESVLKMRQEIAQERKEMEDTAYKSFVDERVAVTPIGQPSGPNEDILDINKKQLPIYQKIEECRMALERKDLVGARRMYNELRDDFAKLKLESKQKSIIYNDIRELYDDIHLLMLG